MMLILLIISLVLNAATIIFLLGMNVKLTSVHAYLDWERLRDRQEFINNIGDKT